MANSLKCDLCPKPATVHLTQIVNSKIHKVDLCEACAQAKGVTDPAGFSLADLLLKASLNPEQKGDIRCESCGFTQQDFKKTGRFGCPSCYSHFSNLLEPMLDTMHKGVTHTGKVPQRALERKSLYERLTQLETDLELAIKAERYEDAARYRDELHQVKQAGRLNLRPEMKINELIDSHSELTDAGASKSAVVLMTRIRLARNLAKHPFPGWAKDAQKREIRDQCMQAVAALPQMKRGLAIPVENLDELQKQILVERHLISRELCHAKSGAGIVISKDQSCVVMINEEDHLRIQVLRAGYQFKKVWNTINTLDSDLEEHLDYAFSPKLGYLSACPTNLGTAIRASTMMHLPALVISSQMEKVVRAVNQLGMAVRGLFGEGSDASGSIFQISNQTTLGESEDDIIKHLNGVLNTIIEQELNAREKLVEGEPNKLSDKIGRAYGILQNGYLLNSSEAMNLLSLIRLGIDLGIFADAQRAVVDRLLIECQPAHVQHAAKGTFEPSQRDLLRAEKLRNEFAKMPAPDFSNTVR